MGDVAWSLLWLRGAALGVVVMLGGCQGPAPAAGAAPVVSVAEAPDASLPRRPSRRHYLARTAERCEVYSVSEGVTSPAERTPCPQDLLVGERIRVTGRVCMREGEPARVTPVVCPTPLLKADLDPRDGGL